MVGHEQQKFIIHGSVFREKGTFVSFTRFLHRILPLSMQRGFRDGGSFRSIADGGAMTAAFAASLTHPMLLLRFLALGKCREDHRYGPHPRQVIELFRTSCNSIKNGDGRPNILVFVHGGAWGSGCTWMYRLIADRLCSKGYSVALIGYRVYPDAEVGDQVKCRVLCGKQEWEIGGEFVWQSVP
ncbi:unnamed protein product [Choristocarpus tenellus]